MVRPPSARKKTTLFFPCLCQRKTNNFLGVLVPPATPAIFLGRKGQNSDEEDIRKHEMSLGIQDNSAAGE